MRAAFTKQTAEEERRKMDCWQIHKWTENTIRFLSRFATVNQSHDGLRTYPETICSGRRASIKCKYFYWNTIHLCCSKCRFAYFTRNQRTHAIAMEMYGSENKHYIILLISFACHLDWLHHYHTLLNMGTCGPHTPFADELMRRHTTWETY